ncbi:hypothetical protein [Persephonella sp.]
MKPTSVYNWEAKDKPKEKPKIDKKVLERFAPKYIRELKTFGYNVEEFFLEKEKRYSKKDKAMDVFFKDYIGENRKVEKNIGDTVKFKQYPKREKIIAIHKDVFGNEYILTDYQVKHIYNDIDRKKKKARYKQEYLYGLKNIRQILKNPDIISVDKNKKESIYYVSVIKDKAIAVVVNKDMQNIRTILVNRIDYFKKSDRFIFKELKK